MKYLLINQKTGQETLCDKVAIDGFDYYVSDEKFKDLKSDSNYLGFVFNHLTNGQFFVCNKINELINEKYQTIWNDSDYRHYSQWYLSNFIKSGSWEIHKVIATNNPNIDIPKVIDMCHFLNIEELFDFNKKLPDAYTVNNSNFYEGFKRGYNKSQETHPFSEEDVIEFERFCKKHDYENGFGRTDRKELLQLWKEQQPKKVYYEN